ncbi:hypothetical protein EUTSA_v10008218mg [Eutrema salsugineum]|uniref:DUF1664 domain-containing protein n=1 Tax=Eutrema salsugineum TaxID=72664 RepID=V4KYG5_EUTSA|nr:uncharacterized protein LOC18994371 isoform X1 [Eutrema salsugineum]ESQ36429.1 hypothetical protein EUTSA_v10008218mg [Eutrema salsugineum]
MAMQAGVQTSKVLILLGAGVSGSIVLRHGRLSELIAQLQELLQGAEGVESTPYKYDTALLAAQIRQLANEIKELSMINPVTIFNGDSNSNGYASYLVPAAAVGAMGYCYMWWKGWSFSDAMFVTKKNMANAVASVSKQLNDLSETLASTKKHLSKELAKLDWKVEEQTEMSKMILSDVTDMRSSISQIGFDFQQINDMISGLEGKIESIESKQDVTLSGLWHLCQVAGVKDSTSTKVFQDVGARLPLDTKPSADNALSGLRFLTEGEESVNVIHKPVLAKESPLMVKPVEEKTKVAAGAGTRVHRAYPGGISWVRDVTRLS